MLFVLFQSHAISYHNWFHIFLFWKMFTKNLYSSWDSHEQIFVVCEILTNNPCSSCDLSWVDREITLSWYEISWDLPWMVQEICSNYVFLWGCIGGSLLIFFKGFWAFLKIVCNFFKRFWNLFKDYRNINCKYWSWIGNFSMLKIDVIEGCCIEYWYTFIYF